MTIEASVPFEEQQQEQEPRIYDITDGLKSKYTKKVYALAFNHFLDVTIKNTDKRALLNTKENVVRSKIIDHLKHLKEVEGLTYRSILVHLAAIFHFFEINDYDDLKRRKIKRFLPEDESEYYARDRPYSLKEIEQILSKCNIRARLAVLLMVSTGMRIGGLGEVRIGDIKKIEEFGVYLIWVYNRSGKDRYYTFCTQECAAAIDDYLSYRQKFGERSTGTRLFHGDFIEKSKDISDNSVDLIFTDLPYEKEPIPLYGELAKVAQRVLKSGGNLIAYAEGYLLLESADQIRNNSSSLKWNWQLIMLHDGNKQAVHGPKVL